MKTTHLNVDDARTVLHCLARLIESAGFPEGFTQESWLDYKLCKIAPLTSRIADEINRAEWEATGLFPANRQGGR